MFWDIHTIYHLVQSSTHFLGGWKCSYCFWNLGTRQKIIRFYSCISPFKTHLVADINWKLLSRTWVAESHLTWAEMVFCFQNCSDLLWEKNCFSDREKLEIRDWRPRILKIFEITRTIDSNSERSEQFLVTECLFNLFLEVSHI